MKKKGNGPIARCQPVLTYGYGSDKGGRTDSSALSRYLPEIRGRWPYQLRSQAVVVVLALWEAEVLCIRVGYNPGLSLGHIGILFSLSQSFDQSRLGSGLVSALLTNFTRAALVGMLLNRLVSWRPTEQGNSNLTFCHLCFFTSHAMLSRAGPRLLTALTSSDQQASRSGLTISGKPPSFARDNVKRLSSASGNDPINSSFSSSSASSSSMAVDLLPPATRPFCSGAAD